MDDNDKSSGVFDSNGLLSKQDIKALRKMLRETKSCIWDMVISFEELFGKEHLFHYEQAIGLLNNILPKFFKSANLNPKNIIWYAGLHENTDNRHIHISFFEKEPTFYNHRKKEYKYHRGKIPITAVKELKLNAENYFNSPMEELKIKRKKLLESLKLEMASKSFDEFESSLKWLLKGLFEEIPRSGRIGYDSESMKPFKERFDNVITLILEKSVYKDDYKVMLDTINEHDEKLKKKCRKYNLDENEYLYGPKFKHDLYRRMGNVLIKEIINPYDFVRIFDVIKKIEIIPIVVITAIGILAARVLILPKIIKEKLIIQNNKGGHSKKLFPLSFKLIQSLRLIISLAIDTYFVSSVSIKGYSPSCKKYNTKQSINKNADKNIL